MSKSSEEKILNPLLFIVKPWSKSKSLSQQTPKLNKSPQKKEKGGFGPRANTIIYNHMENQYFMVI